MANKLFVMQHRDIRIVDLVATAIANNTTIFPQIKDKHLSIHQEGDWCLSLTDESLLTVDKKELWRFADGVVDGIKVGLENVEKFSLTVDTSWL